MTETINIDENINIDNEIEINQEVDIDKAETVTDENSKILNFIMKYSFTLFIINVFFLSTSVIIITTITFLYNEEFDKYFWLNQIIKYIAITIIQFIMAFLVTSYNIKVNYTRKVIHISYFLIPQLLDTIIIRYQRNIITEIWNVWIILLLLIILSEYIRKKLYFIDYMFKAVDRPEDQPYTLIWFASQIIIGLFVILPFSLYFNSIDKNGFTFIPILVNGLADGFAEPVGIRFGKHKYQTTACLTSKKYTRSYEGSLCVYIITLIITLSYYNYMTFNQYIFMAILLPSIVTFTEAFAPHTWDCPFLFFVTCSLLSISYHI